MGMTRDQEALLRMWESIAYLLGVTLGCILGPPLLLTGWPWLGGALCLLTVVIVALWCQRAWVRAGRG
jgi:hypothetical protein